VNQKINTKLEVLSFNTSFFYKSPSGFGIFPILGEPKGNKKDGNIKHVYRLPEWRSRAGRTSVGRGSKNTTYYRSLIYNV